MAMFESGSNSVLTCCCSATVSFTENMCKSKNILNKLRISFPQISHVNTMPYDWLYHELARFCDNQIEWESVAKVSLSKGAYKNRVARVGLDRCLGEDL